MNWGLDQGTYRLDAKRAAFFRGNDGLRAGKGGLCGGQQGAGAVRELGVYPKKGDRPLSARIFAIFRNCFAWSQSPFLDRLIVCGRVTPFPKWGIDTGENSS